MTLTGFVLQLPAESQVNNNSTHRTLTEEERLEAEALKCDGEWKGLGSQLGVGGALLLAGDLVGLVSAGNDQMKVENFSTAVEFYSKAIAINPHNAVYYCNRLVRAAANQHAAPQTPAYTNLCVCVCRAAAYSKLGNYAGAVQDCEEAISIDPNYSKAYGRMGYDHAYTFSTTLENYKGHCRTLLDCSGHCRTLLDSRGDCKTLLDCRWLCRTLLDCMGHYGTLLDCGGALWDPVRVWGV